MLKTFFLGQQGAAGAVGATGATGATGAQGLLFLKLFFAIANRLSSFRTTRNRWYQRKDWNCWSRRSSRFVPSRFLTLISLLIFDFVGVAGVAGIAGKTGNTGNNGAAGWFEFVHLNKSFADLSLRRSHWSYWSCR